MNIHQYFLNKTLMLQSTFFPSPPPKKSAILGKQIRWFYSMLMMKQRGIYEQVETTSIKVTRTDA